MSEGGIGERQPEVKVSWLDVVGYVMMFIDVHTTFL